MRPELRRVVHLVILLPGPGRLRSPWGGVVLVRGQGRSDRDCCSCRHHERSRRCFLRCAASVLGCQLGSMLLLLLLWLLLCLVAGCVVLLSGGLSSLQKWLCQCCRQCDGCCMVAKTRCHPPLRRFQKKKRSPVKRVFSITFLINAKTFTLSEKTENDFGFDQFEKH